MDRRTLLQALGLSAVSLPGCTTPGTQSPESLYHELLETFDSPVGYGYDTHPRDKANKQPRHWPMAYSLVASAEAHRFQQTGAKDAYARAISTSNWLVEHRDRNQNDVIGWGLPFAWDAGGDSSTNPAHTEYGITTALAAQALLDVAKIHKSSAKTQEYVKTVESALLSFVDGEKYNRHSETLCFWYSYRSVDSYEANNVSSMLAGMCQRLASEWEVSSSARLSEAADAAIAYLLKQPRWDETTLWYYFGEQKPPGHESRSVNDVLHQSYTVEGVLTYAQHGGSLGGKIIKTTLLDDFENYIFDNHVRERPNDDALARLWGVGYMLAIDSIHGPGEFSSVAMEDIRQLKRQGNITRGKNPGWRGIGSVRHNAHLLYGMSKAVFDPRSG